MSMSHPRTVQLLKWYVIICLYFIVVVACFPNLPQAVFLVDKSLLFPLQPPVTSDVITGVTQLKNKMLLSCVTSQAAESLSETETGTITTSLWVFNKYSSLAKLVFYHTTVFFKNSSTQEITYKIFISENMYQWADGGQFNNKTKVENLC